MSGTSGLIGIGNTFEVSSGDLTDYPFINNLVDNQVIDNRTFAVYFYPNPNFGNTSQAGVITFGGYNPDFMVENFTFFPVI
jgi:hypothetical protein